MTYLRKLGLSMLLAVLATLPTATNASAVLTGDFKNFQGCPYSNPGVSRCITATIDGGEVVLGERRVPVTNEVVLRGGIGEPDSRTAESVFIAPTDGEALSVASQPIPGGIVGMTTPATASPVLKAVSALAFDNALTGLSASLWLAGPASEIRISENHLGEQEEVAVKMPVRLLLENPFLGGACYVGSPATPIVWEFTTGTMRVPGKGKSLEGKPGALALTEGGALLKLSHGILVDGAWAAPAASGCGGPFSPFVDPVVNDLAKLPSPEGQNIAVLTTTIYEAPAQTVKANAEEDS